MKVRYPSCFLKSPISSSPFDSLRNYTSRYCGNHFKIASTTKRRASLLDYPFAYPTGGEKRCEDNSQVATSLRSPGHVLPLKASEINCRSTAEIISSSPRLHSGAFAVLPQILF